MTRIPPPPGWGADSLTDFIETAYRNRWATFVNKEDWFLRLARLDGCFMRIVTDWVNPQDMIAPLLFLRSHSAYRAACEHALAGQAAETYPQIRTSIEYAAYALHINRNPALAEVWLKRHDGVDAMRAVKNEFTVAKVRATIEEANRDAAGVFDLLYQRSVDFGGHPNERAITGNLTIIDLGDRKLFEQIYLHGQGPAFDQALKSTAQTGVCVLEIFQAIFAARFELLGVRAELLELRRGL